VLSAGLALCGGILLTNGPPWGHDASFHAHLADGLLRGLADGHLYPRWISEANRGYGSPVLIFYSPGSSYAVAVASLFAADTLDAMRWTAIASAGLAGLAFYACARDFSGRGAAALGSAIYVLLPYHGLDLYERFAFAEYNSFVWMPLVVRSLRRLMRSTPGDPSFRWAILGLAISYAALVFTHLLVAFMALFFIAPYLLLAPTHHRAAKLAGAAAAGLGALSLAAVYLVPLAAERGATHSEHLLSMASGPVERNFAFRDEEAMGYGRSTIKSVAERSLWTVGLLAAAALVLLPRKRAKEGYLLAGLGALAIALQTPLSEPLWRLVSPMSMIVYPWRFQLFQGLFAGLLVAWVLERRPGPFAWALVAVASTPALLLTGSLVAREHETLDQASFDTRRIARHVQLEHIPSGVPYWNRFSDRGHATMQGRIRKNGPASIEVEEWSSHTRRLLVEVNEPREIVLRTFAYPGWQVRLDGQTVPLRGDALYDAIAFEVTPETREVEVVYEPPMHQRIAALVSVISLAAWVALAGATFARRRSRPASD